MPHLHIIQIALVACALFPLLPATVSGQSTRKCVTFRGTSFCCPDNCSSCGVLPCNSGRAQKKSNCCLARIKKTKRFCGIFKEPCIIPGRTGTEICTNTRQGVVCCPSRCGKCGSFQCEARLGGASECCPSRIIEDKRECGLYPAPCFAPSLPSAICEVSNGKMICCPKGCDACETAGCTDRKLGKRNCCPLAIGASGRSCQEYWPPCIADQNVKVPKSSPRPHTNKLLEKSPGLRDKVCVPNVEGWVCCPKTCGECGGKGCGSRPGGAESCCTSNISDQNMDCGSNSPPCIFPVPKDAICTRVGDTIVCCPESCGACGGDGCAGRPGGLFNCCASSILTTGKDCKDGGPPCIFTISIGSESARATPGASASGNVDPVERAEPASGNVEPVESADPASEDVEPVESAGDPPDRGMCVPDDKGWVCCPKTCGECGGDGCGSRPGGAESCCTSSIIDQNMDCGSNSPPCIFPVPKDTICTRVGDTIVCCPESCGACGGDGCRGRPGGGFNCCASSTSTTGKECKDGGPPCIFTISIGSESTRATPSASASGNVEPVESAGDPPDRGMCVPDDKGWVCCPKTCGECGGKGCGSRPGGVESCCTSNIIDQNMDCGSNSPPCIFPVPKDAICNRVGDTIVCCPESCGACGGDGCAGRPGGLFNCCSFSILTTGKECKDGGPPCIFTSIGSESPNATAGASATPSFGAATPGNGVVEEADGGVCVDVQLLRGVAREELVFEEDSMAAVLCDVDGSCATAGHVVVFRGRAMMMWSYCEIVRCERRVVRVNSPRLRRKARVRTRTEGLLFTAFAARWGTRVEERLLAAAVHVGL